LGADPDGIKGRIKNDCSPPLQNSNTCIFLQGGGRIMHDAEPKACRDYPPHIEKIPASAGVHVDLDCPGGGDLAESVKSGNTRIHGPFQTRLGTRLLRGPGSRKTGRGRLVHGAPKISGASVPPPAVFILLQSQSLGSYPAASTPGRAALHGSLSSRSGGPPVFFTQRKGGHACHLDPSDKACCRDRDPQSHVPVQNKS